VNGHAIADPVNISMCLIVILGRCFSGADVVARRVSEKLGYRLVDADAISERAAAWSVPEEQLREALRPIPFLRRCFRQGSEVELAALRAALAEEAAASEAVYSGHEGLLLQPHVTPVLRIRLKRPLQCRIAALERRLRLTGEEARRYIRRADRAYRQWVRRVSGSDDEDPALYDLVVDVNDGDFDSACRTITAFASRHSSLATGTEYRAAMTELALASRIEAVLKMIPETARLNASVTTDRGLVFLAAAHWNVRDREAIRGVVCEIPGVRRVGFIDWRPQRQGVIETLRNRVAVGWRRWAAGATVCSLLAAGTLLLKHLDSSTPDEVTSVTGVITDTRCAGNHRVSVGSEKSRCVRDCVRVQNQAKYALFDGVRVYTLSNQGLGDQFAARAVTVAGRLNPKNNVLQVHSITPCAGTMVPF
jgi:cytidylate kinase